MKGKINTVNDDVIEQLSIKSIKAKLAVSSASLESQQANRHTNGELTHDR